MFHRLMSQFTELFIPLYKVFIFLWCLSSEYSFRTCFLSNLKVIVVHRYRRSPKTYFEGIAANAARLLWLAIYITHTIDPGRTRRSSITPPVFLDLYLNRRQFARTYFPLKIVQLNRWSTHKHNRRSIAG